jgi:hypothetical protein
MFFVLFSLLTTAPWSWGEKNCPLNGGKSKIAKLYLKE